MLVVDTSVLVDYLRGDPVVGRFLDREAQRGDVMVPALAAWELWRGASTPRRRTSVDALLLSLRVDPFSAAIARLAGDLHLRAKEVGRVRPAWDLLIAAHAIHHDCPLATRDGDHDGIEGLDVFRVA